MKSETETSKAEAYILERLSRESGEIRMKPSVWARKSGISRKIMLFALTKLVKHHQIEAQMFGGGRGAYWHLKLNPSIPKDFDDASAQIPAKR